MYVFVKTMAVQSPQSPSMTANGVQSIQSPSNGTQSQQSVQVLRLQRAATKKVEATNAKKKDLESCVRQEELSKGIDASRPTGTSKQHKVKDFLRTFVQGCRLDAIMGFVILANSAVIGLETDAAQYDLDPPNDTRFIILENLFLVIYLIELSLHIWLEGIRYCSTGWGAFDTFIVGVGCLTTWIIAPMGNSLNEVQQVSDKIMIGRVCRLLKLARAIRMMSRFKILWSMVRGLFNALGVLLWTFVLVTTLLFLFAVAGVELVGREEHWVNPEREGDEEWEAVKELALNQFGTMFSAMLTLLQFMTLDSWIGVVQPIVYEKPALMLYFLVVILVCAIALMNLVTATIVNSALDASAEDKSAEKVWLAAQRLAVKDKLAAAFTQGDSDGDGFLTKEELQEHFESDKTIQMQLEVFGSLEDILGLYDIIDREGSGSLTIHRLLDGLSKYREDKHGFLLQCIHDQLMEETSARRPSRIGTPSQSVSPVKVPQTNGAYSTPIITPSPSKGVLKGGQATSPAYGESPLKLAPPEPPPDELLESLNVQIRSWENRVESKISGVMTQAGAVSAKLNECCADLQSHIQGNHAAVRSHAPAAPFSHAPKVVSNVPAQTQPPAAKWQAASTTN